MPKPPLMKQLDWQAIYTSGTDYKTWLDGAENPDHKAKMLENYDQTVVLESEWAALKNLAANVHIVVIAEDWCGDVVRNVPALEKLIAGSGTVSTRYITREQHPEVFIRFLTNGGEAIPKMIFLSKDWVETGNWGPMPHALREHIARGKAAGDVAASRKITGLLYKADSGLRDVVKELLQAIDVAATTTITLPAE
ncbi:MAG: thioredoxin family protein [Sumerlaeia bacterium]